MNRLGIVFFWIMLQTLTISFLLLKVPNFVKLRSIKCNDKALVTGTSERPREVNQNILTYSYFEIN